MQRKTFFCRGYAAMAAVVLFALGAGSGAGQMNPVQDKDGITLPAAPATAVHGVVDDYHGVKIEDPYRWLEDAKSPETRAWIDEQNKYTQTYLSQVKMRPEIVRELTALERVDEYSMPMLRGGKYFFTKRLAGENQASIYVRAGWTGEDRRLVDATRLSADQDTSVEIEDVSADGGTLVYGVRQGGADEATVHVMRVNDGRDFSTGLQTTVYFRVSLSPDDQGLYYSRYSKAGSAIWYHRLKTTAEKDVEIFGGEYLRGKHDSYPWVSAWVTANGRYLMIQVFHGNPATTTDLLVKDLRRTDSKVVPLVSGVKGYAFAVNAGERFFVQTSDQAPNGRIVEVKPGMMPGAWKTVVPESTSAINEFSVVGNRLFVSRMHDVRTETAIYSLDGKERERLSYPEIGAASVVNGRPEDMEGFYTFESFILPLSIYRYDVKTGKSESFFTPKVPFDLSQYEVTQIFYTSKDGTRVPMFIAGKKGLARDGKARLLMTGYGGFDIPMLPEWNPAYAWWMEQGGFFAVPTLRGGNEYGESWHKAAMFANKQNVFDDFFAAAEYLINNGYTSPERFAIRGRSNGGLLMGAAITQRPELFGAIWCGYPLLDMLRYQKFEDGPLWTTEYGNAENAKDFPYLVKYSPYQNVKPGTKYPAIMFFTGDSDTRVDPLHARKMTARVQAANAGHRPILLHYSLKGGHSDGVALAQLVEDQADELSFLWTETSGK